MVPYFATKLFSRLYETEGEGTIVKLILQTTKLTIFIQKDTISDCVPLYTKRKCDILISRIYITTKSFFRMRSGTNNFMTCDKYVVVVLVLLEYWLQHCHCVKIGRVVCVVAVDSFLLLSDCLT